MSEENKRIDMSGPGFRLVLDGPAESFLGQDLVARAVKHLIEGYDSGSLQKQGDYEAAYAFYGKALSAVARHHWHTEDHGDEIPETRQFLRDLVDWLHESGHLEKIDELDGGESTEMGTCSTSISTDEKLNGSE